MGLGLILGVDPPFRDTPTPSPHTYTQHLPQSPGLNTAASSSGRSSKEAVKEKKVYYHTQGLPTAWA